MLSTLTVGEVRIIETLVMKKGYIQTWGMWGSGWLYVRTNRGHSHTLDVSRKTIKNLFKRKGLLTRRISHEVVYPGDDAYKNIYEVYLPSLSKFECLKELAVQYAVGAV